MFLERGPLVASLREIRSGAMVFVAGEAGIGKTSLIREFCATLPTATGVRYGFCDALGTPRALGPLHDIARGNSALAELLATSADRHAIFTAFLDSLGQSVVVVEDAHWADEATLDLLLFVGRRISDRERTGHRHLPLRGSRPRSPAPPRPRRPGNSSIRTPVAGARADPGSRCHAGRTAGPQG